MSVSSKRRHSACAQPSIGTGSHALTKTARQSSPGSRAISAPFSTARAPASTHDTPADQRFRVGDQGLEPWNLCRVKENPARDTGSAKGPSRAAEGRERAGHPAPPVRRATTHEGPSAEPGGKFSRHFRAIAAPFAVSPMARRPVTLSGRGERQSSDESRSRSSSGSAARSFSRSAKRLDATMSDRAESRICTPPRDVDDERPTRSS